MAVLSPLERMRRMTLGAPSNAAPAHTSPSVTGIVSKTTRPSLVEHQHRNLGLVIDQTVDHLVEVQDAPRARGQPGSTVKGSGIACGMPRRPQARKAMDEVSSW